MSYIAQSDIEAIFGATNVAKWADMDNNANAGAIAARIAAAIAYAEDEIDLRLRGHAYIVPISGTSGSTPRSIVDAAARLAGVWLYESRGMADDNVEIGRHREQVDRLVNRIIAGQVRLDAVRSADHPDVPVIFGA